MGRAKISIPIEGERLSALLQTREKTLSTAASRLGVSRQLLNSWISDKQIPPIQLSRMTREFKFTAQEVRSISRTNRPIVLFRKQRHKSVKPEDCERIRDFVEEYASLCQSTFIDGDRELIELRSNNAEEVARMLLKELELENRPITLQRVIASLRQLKVDTVFIPFDLIVPDEDVDAFAATLNGSRFIFVDSRIELEKSLWVVLHEVAHFALGHSDHVGKEEEKLCNEIAAEMLIPTSFLKTHLHVIKNKLRGQSRADAIFLIDELCRHHGSSFTGAVIRLDSFKLLSKDRHGFLYTIGRNRSSNSPKITDFLSSNLGRVEFWNSAFQDSTRFFLLRLYEVVRNALVAGKISVSRAAEIFNEDISTILSLKQIWRSDVESPAD